jgi:hypothetical protein
MFAFPSGPMETSKKSSSERSEVPTSPPMLTEPVWMMWSLAWLTVNTGSRLFAFSDWANMTFQVEPAGMSFGPPVRPGAIGSNRTGGPTLLDWYQTTSTRPASPAAIAGKIAVPVPELIRHGP